MYVVPLGFGISSSWQNICFEASKVKKKKERKKMVVAIAYHPS